MTIDKSYKRKKEDCTFNPMGEDCERLTFDERDDGRSDDEMDREFYHSLADRMHYTPDRDPDLGRERTLRIINSPEFQRLSYFNQWGEH